MGSPIKELTIEQMDFLDNANKGVMPSELTGDQVMLLDSYFPKPNVEAVREPTLRDSYESGNFVDANKNYMQGLMSSVKDIGISVVGSFPQTYAGIGKLLTIAGNSLEFTDEEGEQAIQVMVNSGVDEKEARRRVTSFGPKSFNSIGRVLKEVGSTTDKYWTKALNDLYAERNPAVFEGSFTENPSFTRAFSAAGSNVANLGMGALMFAATGNPAAVGFMLGALDVASIYEEAKASGKTDTEAFDLFGIGLIGTGVLETASASVLFEKLPKSVMPKLVDIVTGMAGEGSTEYVQTIFQNLVSKYGYDNTRDIFQGAVEAMVGGAISGGAFSAITPKQQQRQEIVSKMATPEEISKVIDATSDAMVKKVKEVNEVFDNYRKDYDKFVTVEGQVGDMAGEGDIASPQEQAQDPITAEAKKYATAKEFVAGTKVSSIDEKLPNVQKGMVRLFRADGGKYTFDEVFDKEELKKQGLTASKEGDFYTTDIKYADYFKETYGKGAEIKYIDVPESFAKDNFERGNEYIIDKQQLTDIWNKAQKMEAKVEDTQSVSIRISKLKNQYINKKSLTKNEIKGFQENIVSEIKNLPLPDKYKAKFLTSIKNANSRATLNRELDNIDRRAKEYFESEAKAESIKAINKELKRTKSKKKGKYDYESNKTFEEIRAINKLTSEKAILELDKLGDDDSQIALMKRRLLQVRINGKKNTSPYMYQKILEDIKALKAIGELSKGIQDFEDSLARRTDREEVLDKIKELNISKDDVLSKAISGYVGGFSNMYSSLNAMFGDKIAKKYDPEYLENKSKTAMSKKTKEIANTAIKIFGLNNESDFIKLNDEMAREEYRIVNPETGTGVDISKDTIIDIYNSLKNDKIKKRYYDTFGQSQVEVLISNLTEDEMIYGDYLQTVAEEYFDVFNQNNIDLFGIDLGRVENYWPATSVKDINPYDDYVTQSEIPSAQKERAKGKVKPKPMSAYLKLQRHIAQAEHVRNLAKRHAELKSLFGKDFIQTEIENAYGKQAYSTLMDQIDNISLNKQTQKLDAISSIVGKALNNWVTAKIALNPGVFFKQLISMGNYMEVMPVAEWHKSFYQGLKSPKETFNFMWKNAEFLEARYNRGYSEAITRAIHEAQKMSKLKNDWTKGLTSWVRAGDIGAIVYGGYPYVKYLQSQGKSLPEAMAMFEQATLKAQQSGLSSGLSQLQNSKNPFARFFLAFKNTANQYFRKQVDATIKKSRGEISGKQYAKTMAIYAIIQPALYAAVGKLVSKIFYKTKDKDDEIMGDIMMEIALNPFNSMIILDDLVNFAARQAMGKNSWKAFNYPLLDDLESGARLLAKDDINMFDVIDGIGALAEPTVGVPVKTYNRIFKNIADILD